MTLLQEVVCDKLGYRVEGEELTLTSVESGCPSTTITSEPRRPARSSVSESASHLSPAQWP